MLSINKRKINLIIWTQTFQGNVKSTYSEPFIDTLGMELVRARQHSEDLPGLEVAHANDAGGLVALVSVRIVLIADQLLYLQLA